MKKKITLVVLLFSTTFLFAQNNFWKASSKNAYGRDLIKERVKPNDFQVYNLDINALKDVLKNVPIRGEENSNKSNVTISIPNANGVFEKYSIIEAPVLHPDLEAKYPGIKSYAGQGIDNPASVIRFSVSNENGFYGMVMDPDNGNYFIDPYTTDLSQYMVYNREEIAHEHGFECTLHEADHKPIADNAHDLPKATNDKKLRKYRLALSCNAEYGNKFCGTTGTDKEKKARVLAQMNTAMTRVNGVYERDLSVTMVLVPNNDTLIFFGSTSADPWNEEWNDKTQEVTDARIGNANYDIGHNFNTSGGGNAGCIGCVCTTGQKGSGFTGSSNPTGDPFYIDYVAHEMGHQFGGYHTMNTCSRSGSGSTEVEPTSGSTIMGYAGICSYNIQNNSDAYFAYVNIRDISLNVKSGVSSACAVITNINNNPPTANAGLDYTIPKSTAFQLRGVGTDPDGDALTYTWEQKDATQAPSTSAPVSTWTVGPLFRSFEGTTNPVRTFPKMSFVLQNNLTPSYEVVPSVARTMNFSLTVRDNKAGGGQTADDLMKVTVANVAPFKVSVINETGVQWKEGESQIITWDYSGTNVAPINCQKVNILLSTNNGTSFTDTLAANTPNDGSHTIIVPNKLSSTCRIKIEAADNIFFDVNDNAFAIVFNPSSNVAEFNNNDVKIYPNPVENSLNIDMGDESFFVKSIKVYSSNGVMLKDLNKYESNIDLSSIEAGVYFISIETNSNKYVKRFIKLSK